MAGNKAAGLSLRANFSWTFIGNAVYAACQWGMLVVLAKLESPEMVGQFALGLAITAPVIIFANLALRQLQVVDVKNEYSFGDYFGLRLTTIPLAYLLIAGIALVGKYSAETTLVILILGLAKAVEAMSDILYGLMQKHERLDRIARSMIIKGVLSLTALGVGVYLSKSVVWGSIGLALVWILILVSYDSHNSLFILKTVSNSREGSSTSPWKRLLPHWKPSILLKLARLTLPLGLATMLIALNSNIPRYFIGYYFGEREVGIYSALAYLQVAGGIVVSALGQSASPRLSKYYATGNARVFRALLLKMVGLGALLGGMGVLVTLVAGHEILTLMYRSEYAEYTHIFAWLMLSAGVSYVSSFLGYGMTAAHYFKIQPILFAIATILTTLFCALLIPGYGLLGAAWAVTIAGFVHTVLVWSCNLHAIKALEKPVAYQGIGR